MNPQESPIQIQEKVFYPKQYHTCVKLICAVFALNLILVSCLGLLMSLPIPYGKTIALILEVLATIAIPIAMILERKKKQGLSKTVRKTFQTCIIMYCMAIIIWASTYLLTRWCPASNDFFILVWLPPIVTAYASIVYLLAIRPGKQSKYVTDLDVKMINDKAHLWIHRHKTYSDILDELVDQRYLFPVAELTTIRMGEGGDTLILEGNAKYMVWPFHMGATPNYHLTDIKDTRPDPTHLVLHPKNDSENAKVAAFYNAIMQARSEL